jgi:serine/threonine-protein kinase
VLLAPGDPFDRYVIDALLGEGGMGRVYSAHDSRLERKVALKILRAPGERAFGTTGSLDSGASSNGPARLLREARAAAALDHPNAVAIFDVGEVDGTPYIAMELVDGRSLRAFIGDASVPLERRLRWLIDVAHALGAAHEHGLVHRDVKPENVMVRNDGVVKVLDFGIARRVRLADDPARPNNATLDVATLTQSGAIVGTPLYMAPEQLRGDVVDGRADQFAWGVVAYELLTGSVPWDTTKNGINLISEVLSSDPRPCANVPAAADATVRKALAKSPRDRFASMEELAAALEPLATQSTRDVSIPSTEPPPPSKDDARTPQTTTLESVAPQRVRSRAPLVLFGAAALAGAVAIGVRATRAPTSAPTASSATPAAVPSGTAITALPAAKTTNTQAAASYLAGLQGIRDASIMSAVTSFRHAVDLDPTIAPAYVRLAWFYAAQGDAHEARTAFQRAAQLRASLEPRDQALLNAIEPLVSHEPSDPSLAEERIGRASDAWPGDAELAFFAGRQRQLLGKREAAASSFDRALIDDPSFAIVWWARAIDAEDTGDLDAALVAYGKCVEMSPGAASCLRSRSVILAQRGSCADVEADARRMVAIEPGGHRAYESLARALCARGRPLETVRQALEQKWALLPESARKRAELVDRTHLALLYGDFASAEKLARELDLLVATARSEQEHVEPTMLLVATYAESGDAARAARTADAFRAKRDAWVAMRAYGDTGVHGALPTLLAIARRAGTLSTASHDAARAAWLHDARAGGSPLWERELWVPAYAAPAETADEANEALAALPPFLPLPPPRELVMTDAAIGKVYALAGRTADALPYLRRGAATCLALDEPVMHTRAHLFLGQALEASGDVAGACAAYGVVIARWGSAPKSLTADKARARARAIGCGRSQ